MWQLMIEPATHRVEPRLIESNGTTANVVVATTADVVVVGHDKTGKEKEATPTRLKTEKTKVLMDLS